MSATDPPVNAPADPLAAALALQAARLLPGAAEQLSVIWKEDFAGLSPALVQDLVAVRLQSPQYGHFLARPAGAAPPTREEIAQLNGSRAYEQLRTIVATARAQGPGLAGTFPKR